MTKIPMGSFKGPTGDVTPAALAAKAAAEVARDEAVEAAAQVPGIRADLKTLETSLPATYVTPSGVAPLIEAAVADLDPSTGFIVTSDAHWKLVLVANQAPAPLPLTAPTLTSLVAGKSQATATWTAPSPLDSLAPITDYSVRYRIVGTGSWNYFAHAASTALTRVITGLANGAANNYEVQVAAVNAAGVGAYSASLTVTPGAVNGTVVSDSGARTAADLVGSAPTVGPESWAGTAGNFAVDGSYIASKSTAAGNLQTLGVGAKGLFKLTGVLNVDTVAGAAAAISTRAYLKYKDSSNYLYLQTGISTAGAPSFSLFCNAAGSGATLALGMPAGAIPTGAAAADYAFSIEQTSDTALSVTVNGVTRTTTLTTAQSAAIADAATIAFTSNSQRIKYKSLILAVNGYYN